MFQGYLVYYILHEEKILIKLWKGAAAENDVWTGKWKTTADCSYKKLQKHKTDLNNLIKYSNNMQKTIREFSITRWALYANDEMRLFGYCFVYFQNMCRSTFGQQLKCSIGSSCGFISLGCAIARNWRAQLSARSRPPTHWLTGSSVNINNGSNESIWTHTSYTMASGQ